MGRAAMALLVSLAGFSAWANPPVNPALLASLWNPQMPAAVYFDGTGHLSAPVPGGGWPWGLTGLTKGTLSVWLKPQALPLYDSRYSALFQTAPTVERNDGGGDGMVMNLEIDNFPEAVHPSISGFWAQESSPTCIGGTAGARCAGFIPGADVMIVGLWQHLMCAWDTAALFFSCYVDDEKMDLKTWTGGQDVGGYHPFDVHSDQIRYVNFFFMEVLGHAVSPYTYVGGASEYWLRTGVVLDPADVANRRKFEDATYHQVFLGPYGEVPLNGREPDVYFSAWEPNARWGCNFGGAGHGISTGLFGRQMPRIPGPNSLIIVGKGGWVPGWPALPPWPFLGKPEGRC